MSGRCITGASRDLQPQQRMRSSKQASASGRTNPSPTVGAHTLQAYCLGKYAACLNHDIISCKSVCMQAVKTLAFQLACTPYTCPMASSAWESFDKSPVQAASVHMQRH